MEKRPEDVKAAGPMEAEQEGLLRDVSQFRERFRGKGHSWSKLRGDAFAKLVFHYLRGHLPLGFKLVTIGWVEGSGIEFDLLVVDEDAEPERFTNIYSKSRVHLLIEVKGSGYFYKRVEVADRLREQRKRVQTETGKPILYLLLREDETNSPSVLRGIGRNHAFILKVGERKIPGEWARFVERANALLRGLGDSEAVRGRAR